MFIGVQCIAEVKFSVQRGYYSNNFQLTLSSHLSGAKIIYTTNNSKPSSTNGLVYGAEPLLISNTTTIKALAYNQTDTSQVISHTYIFLKDVIEANYMDTSITQSTLYQPLMEQSFFSVPIISISSDAVQIGENFEPGIETWGGSKFNLKKHYRLEFKTKYGEDELNYPLFDDMEYPIKPATSFNRLLLRSGSQDGLNCEFCDESKALFIRNRVMMDLQMLMGYPAPHGKFVHLLVNQQYEGVYHLMERPDHDFFKDYYFKETPKKEIEVRKNNDFWQQPNYLTLYDQLEIISQEDLSKPDNFNHLSKYLDVKQTATYLLLNDYGGNFDWSKERNNLGAATTTHPYKFILWDIDLTLGNEGVFEETYGDQLPFNSIEFIGPIPKSIVNNKNFKMIWADVMQCNCFNEGALHPEKIKQVFTQRSAQIETALIAESARWGNVDFEFNLGHLQNNNWDVYDEWQATKNAILTQFISKRTDTLVAQYKAAGIFPNLKAVEFVSQNPLSNQEKIELYNPNEKGAIYYTTNGEDPKNFNGTIAETALLYKAPFSISTASTIKARVFADSIWSAMCPLKYFHHQSYDNLIINEIHYQPVDSIKPVLDTIAGKHFEFIELYNKGTETIALAGISLSEGIQYQFNSSTKIEPEEYLILASDSMRFVERYQFSPSGTYQGNLSNEGEAIRLNDPFNNNIMQVSYALDFPWQNAAGQAGYSLSLKQVDLDPLNLANWLYSKESGGTPGKLNFMETDAQGIETQAGNFLELLINPISNQLIIISKKTYLKNLQIFNIQNQLVYAKVIRKNESTVNIDSFLAKGLYVILLRDAKHILVKKIVL